MPRALSHSPTRYPSSVIQSSRKPPPGATTTAAPVAIFFGGRNSVMDGRCTEEMMSTSSLAARGEPAIRYFSAFFALFSEPGAPLGQSSTTGCLLATGTISFGGGPGIAGGTGASCAKLAVPATRQDTSVRSAGLRNCSIVPGPFLWASEQSFEFTNMHTCELTVQHFGGVRVRAPIETRADCRTAD